MQVDMHIHSTASDGTWTPTELVRRVQQARIKVFSVTDHDSVESIYPAKELARRAGLIFIPGVEISAAALDRDFHILAYGIDPTHPELLELLAKNQREMERRDDQTIEELAQRDKRVSVEEYQAYEHPRERGGWKSLNYLLDKGVCRDVADFFARCFVGIKPEFPPVYQVCRVVRQAGGWPVVAHPGARLSQAEKEGLPEVFGQLTGMGIGGIECFHPFHDAELSTFCRQWCMKHDLLITGGSDCHGDFEKVRVLGQPQIDLSDLSIGPLLSDCEEICHEEN